MKATKNYDLVTINKEKNICIRDYRQEGKVKKDQY